jgi:F-type H+-transporting ATPase subunit gamma
MASYRELKHRIGGVQNIQQITRAMKMVAAARLRRAEEAVLAVRPYCTRLERVCACFLRDAVGSEHPFMERRPVQNVAVVSIASDRGLCGSYNNRITEATMQLVKADPGRTHRIFAVGQRGASRLKRVTGVEKAYVDVFNPVAYETAEQIIDDAGALFLAGEVDEVVLIYTMFFSPLRQEPAQRCLLPFAPAEYLDDLGRIYGGRQPEGVDFDPQAVCEEAAAAFIYEPDYEAICGPLLRRNATAQLYRALLEAQASEHGARMIAMDNATENADEMIEELTLHMNRIRQEDITTELLDVVGGAGALEK